MMTTAQIKASLRAGKYAWPGGYPCYFVTCDGEPLSFEAVRTNYRVVCGVARAGKPNEWGVVGVYINYEDPAMFCAHTGLRIESAYAEDGATQ